MASAGISAGPATRPGERLLKLMFAVSVGGFFWAFVAGLVYLVSVQGSLPLRTDPLTGARLRLARGDAAGALRQYRIATRIDPSDTRALNEMAELLVRNGRLDEARGAFEQSLRVAPNQANAWNGVGTTRALQGDFDRAIEAFETALAIGPESPARANLERARADQARARTQKKTEP